MNISAKNAIIYRNHLAFHVDLHIRNHSAFSSDFMMISFMEARLARVKPVGKGRGGPVDGVGGGDETEEIAESREREIPREEFLDAVRNFAHSEEREELTERIAGISVEEAWKILESSGDPSIKRQYVEALFEIAPTERVQAIAQELSANSELVKSLLDDPSGVKLVTEWPLFLSIGVREKVAERFHEQSTSLSEVLKREDTSPDIEEQKDKEKKMIETIMSAFQGEKFSDVREKAKEALESQRTEERAEQIRHYVDLLEEVMVAMREKMVGLAEEMGPEVEGHIETLRAFSLEVVSAMENIGIKEREEWLKNIETCFQIARSHVLTARERDVNERAKLLPMSEEAKAIYLKLTGSLADEFHETKELQREVSDIVQMIVEERKTYEGRLIGNTRQERDKFYSFLGRLGSKGIRVEGNEKAIWAELAGINPWPVTLVLQLMGNRVSEWGEKWHIPKGEREKAIRSPEEFFHEFKLHRDVFDEHTSGFGRFEEKKKRRERLTEEEVGVLRHADEREDLRLMFTRQRKFPARSEEAWHIDMAIDTTRTMFEDVSGEFEKTQGREVSAEILEKHVEDGTGEKGQEKIGRMRNLFIEIGEVSGRLAKEARAKIDGGAEGKEAEELGEIIARAELYEKQCAHTAQGIHPEEIQDTAEVKNMLKEMSEGLLNDPENPESSDWILRELSGSVPDFDATIAFLEEKRKKLELKLEKIRREGGGIPHGERTNEDSPIIDLGRMSSAEREESHAQYSDSDLDDVLPSLASVTQFNTEVRGRNEELQLDVLQSKCSTIPALLEQARSGQISAKELVSKLDGIEFQGKKLIITLPDNEFEKKFKKVTNTGFVFDSDSHQIIIAESKYRALSEGNDPDGELTTSLLHELGHVVCENSSVNENLKAALKKKFKWSEFIKTVKKLNSGEGKKVRESLLFGALQYKRDLSDDELAEEALVWMMAGGFKPEFMGKLQREGKHKEYEWCNEMNRLQSQVEGWVGGSSEFQKIVTPEMSEFSHSMAERFSGEAIRFRKTGTHGSSVGGHGGGGHGPGEEVMKAIETHPSRHGTIHNEWENLEHAFEKKMHTLRTLRAKGAAEFIESLEQAFETAKSIMGDNPTEDDFAKVKAAMGDYNGKMDTAIAQAASQETADVGYFRNLWENTTFLSISDCGQIWDTIQHYMERRHERKSKHRAGKAGGALTKSLRGVSGEFHEVVEEAEKSEVQHLKDSVDNLDAWQIYEHIHHVGNKDALKAYLRVLADKGRIDWRRHEIWDAFMRLGCGVQFYDKDRYNQSALSIKMQKACGVLWDNDEYRTLQSTNRSSYDSRKESFAREADEDIEILGAVTRDMLVEHRRFGKVDPTRYEAYVEMMVKKGKASPEQFMYYIIMGVAEDLLTPERATWFDAQYLNDCPLTQRFFRPTPTIDQFKIWGKQFYTKDGGCPQRFREWCQYEVQQNPFVWQRTYKESAAGKWDHDYMSNIAAIGNAQTAKNITGTDTDGSPKYRPTAYPNVMVGILEHFGIMYRHRNKVPDETLRTEMARQIAYFTTFDAILTGRVISNPNAHQYRMGGSDLRQVPRIIGNIFNKAPDNTAQGLRDASRKIVEVLDPQLYTILYGMRGKGEAAEKTTLDQVLNHMDHAYPGFFNEQRRRPSSLEDFYLSTVQELAELKLQDDKTLETLMSRIQVVMKEMNATQYADRSADMDASGGGGGGDD